MLGGAWWWGAEYYNLDERLQRVKPLCYPPANLIRGKLSFYWSSECHSELSPPRKECKCQGGSGDRAAKA